jgi:hypothetical protein
MSSRARLVAIVAGVIVLALILTWITDRVWPLGQ